MSEVIDQVIECITKYGVFIAVLAAGLFFWVEKAFRLIDWIIDRIRRK